MKWLLHTVFLFMCFSGIGQVKNEVDLKTFFAIPTDNSVELKWVISAGFTCNGTEIYWSKDSVHFERIGGISGFCGSVSEAISYSFTHKNPSSNTVNYYKLELGTNGDSQTISTFYVDLSAETYLSLPNPSNEEMTIYFRNKINQNVSFQIYNSNGILVFEKRNIYDSEVRLNTANLPNGLYNFLILSNEGKPLNGKFVVQH